MRPIRTIAAAALLLAALPAHAALVKCKGAGGAVIYSDEPCKAVGAKEEKTLSRADLRGNRMRMRPRPPQGDGTAPEFGAGSSFKGAAPDKASGPRPVAGK